jgi:hypothetical protein
MSNFDKLARTQGDEGTLPRPCHSHHSDESIILPIFLVKKIEQALLIL